MPDFRNKFNNRNQAEHAIIGLIISFLVLSYPRESCDTLKKRQGIFPKYLPIVERAISGGLCKDKSQIW